MARIIPKRVLEDIRFRNDIADVIGQYLTLQKAGANFKALCPFHKEKTPSFHVNPQRQIYHCFGCSAGGDVFNFIMAQEQVDFMTAVKMLAERAGIELELEDGQDGASNKKQLLDIHAKMAEKYHEALLERTSAAVARDYLKQRDLSDETVKAFRIGYAPNRWDAVLTWAQSNKIPNDVLEASGLVIRDTKSESNAVRFYDRFRHRLMFPITDEQGRVIGFSGRALDEASKGAKYVNSPETPLFHKGRVLYALDKARRSIAESRETIICEGQIDVIRCHQAGFTTAVAAQGTAFTEDHVRILRRYADSVVIVFDPDKAGQEAATRAGRTFLSAGLVVRVARLPTGLDPDTFIRERGGEAFGQLIEHCGSIVRFQVDLLSAREDLTTEVGTLRAARAVLDTIHQTPNAVQKAKMIQEAAQLLRLPASALQADLKHLERREQYRAQARARETVDDGGGRAPRPHEEVALCEHLVHVVDHPELADLIERYLPLKLVTHDDCRTVLRAALASVKEGRDIQEILQDDADPAGVRQAFLAALLMAPRKTKGRDYRPEDAVKDLILFVWRRHLKQERDQLSGEHDARRQQLTYDLKALRDWEHGSTIIELEME